MVFGWFKKKSDPTKEATRPRVPTVKFDPKNVTDDVAEDIKNQINRHTNFSDSHKNHVISEAILSVQEGGNLHRFSVVLQEAGLDKREAAQISRIIYSRATSLINRNRQIKLGLIEAEWNYSCAPCIVDRNNPADWARDKRHKAADGKRYSLKKGLLIGGRYTFPGMEDGCKCTGSVIIPGLKE